MKVLAYSIIDEAGKGIAKELLNMVGQYRKVSIPGSVNAYLINDFNALLVGFKEDVIYFDFLDEVFSNYNVDYYIILSRHSAKSGIKSLTVHHTGNFSSSTLAGGRPFELSVSNPPVTKELLIKLLKLRNEYGLDDFEVTYEVTHHGPTGIRRPLTFIEIGSSPNEWVLSSAHKVVAYAVLSVISSSHRHYCKPVVGIGGPHYAGIFTKRALTTDECYGHIMPRYALKELKGQLDKLREMIIKAVNESSVKTQEIILLKKVGKLVKDVAKEIANQFGIAVEVI